MKLQKEQLKLYAITDRSWLGSQSLEEQVELALQGGITMLQLREKNMPEEELYEEALRIKELCAKYKVPFIINDNVELAKKVDADGVHVGQNDMEMQKARELLGEDKIIGVTAKTIEQAKKAWEAGADYLGSGAVFGSSTKKDAKAMDHQLLQQICESVEIPVVAIGGIDATNVLELAGRKMAGVAVVSGIFAQSDILESTKKLLALTNNII